LPPDAIAAIFFLPPPLPPLRHYLMPPHIAFHFADTPHAAISLLITPCYFRC
jgi:hypothetical protein